MWTNKYFWRIKLLAIKYSFLVESGQKIDEEKKRWETSSPQAPFFPRTI